MISGSWKIKISAKNFTFCWFWLGKMHWNGLGGSYLGFEPCQIQWHLILSLCDKWFLKNQNFRQKFHILLILTGKNALKWLECCIFRVQGMPNPMTQVSNLYNKWFLKNPNFRQIFHILLILTGKMHWNGLNGAYLGFEACQIQWHYFWVSTVTGSGKTKISGEISHFVDFDWENPSKWLEWHVFRVQGMPNPMELVSSLYDKWFLKNQNFQRQIAQYGIKNHQNGMGPMQQFSLHSIILLHDVSEPYA